MEQAGMTFIVGTLRFPSGNELLYVKAWKDHYTAPIALAVAFGCCFLIVCDEQTGCWLVARELTEEC